MYRRVYRHANRPYVSACIDMCIDVCMGTCIDMCVGMCTDMHPCARHTVGDADSPLSIFSVFFITCFKGLLGDGAPYELLEAGHGTSRTATRGRSFSISTATRAATPASSNYRAPSTEHRRTTARARPSRPRRHRRDRVGIADGACSMCAGGAGTLQSRGEERFPMVPRPMSIGHVRAAHVSTYEYRKHQLSVSACC